MLHQSKKISIDLEKLVDKRQIAYGSKSLTEAHPNFSGEQALVIRHALLRGFFLALRDFRPTRTASKQRQPERAPTDNPLIAAIHFSQATSSQPRDCARQHRR